MKLGFHYHVPAISQADGIYMPGDLGRFIDSLAAYCDKVICFLHSPRPEEVSRMNYKIISRNVGLIDIGIHTSVIDRTIKSIIYTSFVRRHASEMDILLVRGPSPLLPAMVAASPVPTALLLVGDYVTGVDDLPQPSWRKEMIRLWSYWNKLRQNRAILYSLTFVNSRVLYNELKDKAPHLHEIRTTTLRRDDFFTRTDTCQVKPYHLLYAGRMDRTKGLLYLVEAVSLLSERGNDVVLQLVGWPVQGDPILQEIQILAAERNVAHRVCYLGSRSLGSELFECYKNADIFVIASFAEGFPRVIWEAMAHSLPVIATRVGSIPAYIEGVAELVEPRSSLELAEAVIRVIHDKDRREFMIHEGRELAMENTLENRACEMSSIMKNYLARAQQTI